MAQSAPDWHGKVKRMTQSNNTSAAAKGGEDAKVRVVSFPDKDPGRSNAQRRRRFWVWATFIPFVLIPVILSVLYFGFIASDRYIVKTKFSVRSPTGLAPTDVLGMMSGVTSSGSTVLDSYIVSDFIESEQLVEKLQHRMDLNAVYDTDMADFLMRYDSSKTKEDFRDYLDWMVSVYFDTSSQVITVEVQAFTPAEAKHVAEEILFLSQELVNEISENARLDTVRTAEIEVTRAEDKLREHRKRVSIFREENQEIDPTISAGSQQTLLGSLESQISRAQTELESMRLFLDTASPQVKIRESEIRALTSQLETQRARLGSGEGKGANAEGNSLTSKVGAFEELAVDLEFLQRSYVSTLVSLEAARLEADRQQRYVATFVLPSTPQKALYPRRVLSVFLVLILSLMAWGIATMSVYIIREHAT